MNERTVHYIDVSKMSEKELCKVLNIKYVPWYRSSLFWALALCFSLPSILIIVEIVKS
jgi:hypothetical protein